MASFGFSNNTLVIIVGNSILEYKSDATAGQLSHVGTIASLTVSSVASAGGDPYLYPLYGPPIKLPNLSTCYRLYQDDHVVLNAEVMAASPTIRAEIEQYFARTGLEPVSTDAYFFTRLFLTNRADPTDWIEADLEQKTCSSPCNGSIFHIGGPHVDSTHYDFYNNTKRHVTIPVAWRDMQLDVTFSTNPQVRNGIRLTGIPQQGTTWCDGLLIRNYRPKIFSDRKSVV